MPMPDDKTPINNQYIADALPSITPISRFQVAFTYLLTMPPEKPDLMSELVATSKFYPVPHKALLEEMAKISQDIQNRNDSLVKAGKPPYPWLQPSKINMSIAI